MKNSKAENPAIARTEAEREWLQVFRCIRSRRQREAVYLTAAAVAYGPLTEVADRKPFYKVFPELK